MEFLHPGARRNRRPTPSRQVRPDNLSSSSYGYPQRRGADDYQQHSTRRRNSHLTSTAPQARAQPLPVSLQVAQSLSAADSALLSSTSERTESSNTAAHDDSTNSRKPQKKSPKKIIATVALLVAGLTVLSGVFFITRSMASLNVAYDSGAFESSTFSAESGEQVTVSHPEQMSVTQEDASGFQLAHEDPRNGGFISHIEVNAAPIGEEESLEETKKAYAALLDNSSDSYTAAVDNIVQNIEASGGSNVRVGSFTSLEEDDDMVNSGMKVNIIYDIPRTNSENKHVAVKARTVYIFSEDTIFLIGIGALDKVWDSNQDTFDEIVRSIRLTEEN